MRYLEVSGARVNNLQEVSIRIPKGRLTVVTGVSGSGKSSLVFDTIAAESRRQLGETMPAFVRNRLPQHARPDADALTGLTAAIVVGQQRIGGNARSTVATATDLAPVLRLLFSRLSEPHVGWSPAFSANDPSGMCPRCEGLGTVVDIDVEKIVDRDRSLNDGAITFSGFAPGGYRWKRIVHSGLFDNDLPLRRFTAAQWDTLLNAQDLAPPDPGPLYPPTSRFSGVLPRLREGYLTGARRVPAGVAAEVEQVITRQVCPECHGDRLAAPARDATVAGVTFGECLRMAVDDLAAFLRTLDDPVARPLVAAMTERLDTLVEVGLGHLTLGRATPTLSGGESQRITLVRHLGSSLTDLTYVLDEPSAGLHPRDVDRLLGLLRRLRDKDNTVLVVEHDPDVIAAADHVIDLGPGAGAAGGRVVFTGSPAGLRRSSTTTGATLRAAPRLNPAPRPSRGRIRISGAQRHHLQTIDVDIPLGVLTAVTGVAGSGKSTLATVELPAAVGPDGPEVVLVDQTPIRGSRRSSPASYLGVLDPLRSAFAAVSGRPAALFSANSDGACPVCRGLGSIETDLAFLDAVTVGCEACGGTGFRPEALAHRVGGRTIADVLALPIADVVEVFTDALIGRKADTEKLTAPLRRTVEVGLGHLPLGRSVRTLSGGERQRLRLAARRDVADAVLVLDEPTAGLHAADVGRLLELFDRLLDRGASIVAVEHDLDVVAAADHVVELGPGAGRDGGRLLYTGPPAALVGRDTATGEHLARRLAERAPTPA